MMESGKDVKHFEFDRYDTYDWYLSLGPLVERERAATSRQDARPGTTSSRHPNYDEFWKQQTLSPHSEAVTVPTLNVAGWWDQEDFYGPLKIYEALEKHDTDRPTSWSSAPGTTAAGAGNGSIARADSVRQRRRRPLPRPGQAPLFAFFLKDKGTLDLPEALTFESGANQWRRWSQWPPAKETKTVGLYFGANEGSA